MNKIAALGYVTDELLQDASIIQAIMEQGFREEIMFEVTDAVFNGDGAGKPLGILKSGAVISITKESGQANDTIVFANLVKMMERLPTRSRSRAVWVMGDSGTETALYSVVLPGGAGYPIFLPPGQNTVTPGNSSFGSLLGRPVIPVEHLPTLGDAGDLMLVDFGEYIMADKGGIQSAESIHVRFVYDETCFRMVYRVDGQPAWRKPVTTANGAMTKSPFIALGAR
jgi:HK97 family phage major capsid protein